MGSFIAQSYFQLHSEKIDQLILSGSNRVDSLKARLERLINGLPRYDAGCFDIDDAMFRGFNLAHAINGGSISVSAQVEGNRLELVVADDGPGIELEKGIPSNGGGVGLSNCRERLKEIYGDSQTFELSKTDPHGLTISICIPLETGAETHE